MKSTLPRFRKKSMPSDPNGTSHMPYEIWHDDESIRRDPITPEYIDWVKRMLNILTIGGYYAMPRSGLQYTRTGENSWKLTGALAQTDPRIAHKVTAADRRQHSYFQVADFHYMYHLSEAAGIELDEQEIVNIPALAVFAKPRPEGPSRTQYGTGKTS